MDKITSPKTQPLVSIITPVFNSMHVLEETIQTVRDQTYQNWELLLIDDCSKDSSIQIIEKYKAIDKRVKGIYLHENKGAGHARNVGLDHVNGDYTAFLDSDDLWIPTKLEEQIKYFHENPNRHFLYTWYSIIDSDGYTGMYYSTPPKINFNLLKFNNYILTSTVICSNKIIEYVRFPSMRRRQDWVFFLDLLQKVEYAWSIPIVLAKYRKMPKTLSSNKLKLIKPNFDMFRHFLHKGSVIKATLHFILFLPFYTHSKIYYRRKTKE